MNMKSAHQTFLKSLPLVQTPAEIQNLLDTFAFNYEHKGETCMSPLLVLEHKKAHCIEGAMLASMLMVSLGQKPLIMSLKVEKGDYDHIVALYKENGYWGAISKTNHAVLRFRDPVYRTVRELALSYFHEYFLVENGKKTMKGYSLPVNLNRFGSKWITSRENLWGIAETIFDMKHIPVIPKGNEKFIRNAGKVEQKAGSIKEWEKQNIRT